MSFSLANRKIFATLSWSNFGFRFFFSLIFVTMSRKGIILTLPTLEDSMAKLTLITLASWEIHSILMMLGKCASTLPKIIKWPLAVVARDGMIPSSFTRGRALIL